MKLYPPHIEGTLPSFYKRDNGDYCQLIIPYSMNPAVGVNEISGFEVLIKNVIDGEILITKRVNGYTTSNEVIFLLEPYDTFKLIVGSYYKIQLAYLDATDQQEVGYYSTVGVIKCTARPIVTIQGLNLEDSNIHKYSYTGYYNNINDPTEKVYQYRFILSDVKGKIIKDTNFLLHNIENNTSNTYESTDTYDFSFDLESDKVFFIQYIIKTNNNLIIKTPKYRIVQGNAGPITEPIELNAYPNFEDGYVKLIVAYEGTDENLYTLNVSEEFDSFLNYYKLVYNLVNITEEQYQPNKYFTQIAKDKYKLCSDEKFYELDDYYEQEYQMVFLDASTYIPKEYYIKSEHFARGNYLITRSCKDTGYKEWNTIATLKIEGYQKEFYNENDYTIEQGKYYKYAIQQYNNYGILSERKVTKEIFADFEDLFLYDGERQLKIRYNPKVSSFKTDLLETKTDTIGGKYPYFFRNGSVAYKEFPITGLISYQMDENYQFVKEEELGFDVNYDSLKRKLTVNNEQIKNRIKENLNSINEKTEQLMILRQKPVVFATKINEIMNEINVLKDENTVLREKLNYNKINQNIIKHDQFKTHNLTSINIAAERYFKIQVLDWLNNGKPKLFRSPNEGNFIVRLMNSSLSPEDALGRMLHNFSTTAYEMAECNYENLKKLNIIHPDEINYNFLLWKTIRLSEPVGRTSNGTVYFVNEKGVYKTVYDGNISYYMEEILQSGRQAFMVSFQNVQPGTFIEIDDEVRVIGATGAYYAESETGFNSIKIQSRQYPKGTVTYSYYGKTKDKFDLIVNEYISQIGADQFIGNDEDIILNLNNPIQTIKDFGYLQFLARDIVEINLNDVQEWERIYYTDNTYTERIYFIEDYNLYDTKRNIFFYEDPDVLDSYVKLSPYGELQSNTYYYLNNEFGLNKMLMTDKPKSNFPYKLKETFNIQYSTSPYISYFDLSYLTNINTYPYLNTFPLYKYQTDKILINGSIIELENNLIVYRDFYYDKYYLDKDTYENLNDSEKKYFKVLSFDITINEKEIINVEYDNKIKMKGEFNFDSLILGNGTILNCSYQVYHKTFAFETAKNIDMKFYNKELAEIRERLDYYESIIKNSSDNDEYNISFDNTLSSVVEKYKDDILNEILMIQLDDSSNFDKTYQAKVQEVVKNYTNFLSVYNRYLNGEITTLTDFLNNVTSLDANNLNFLVKEAIIRMDWARKQYQKDYKEYIRILSNLLDQYEQESDLRE